MQGCISEQTPNSSLEPLSKLIDDDLMQQVLTILLRKQKEKREDTSVPTMALRAVITNVNATPAVARIVTHLVLPGLYESLETLSVDFMDVIIDVLKRFGSSLGASEVKKTLEALITLVSDSKGLVRKRAVTATGLLGRYLNDRQWSSLEGFLLDGLEGSNASTSNAMVLLAGTLARTEPNRVRASFPKLLPKLLACIPADLEELDGEDLNVAIDTCEGVFTSIEALLGLGSATVAPYVSELLDVCRRFIAFDPNFIGLAGDDDDEMQMEDEDGFGLESDDEADFSDDEDQSWKLRRYSARLAGSIGVLNQRQLPLVYSKVLALLVSRLTAEREDTVKGAVIVALAELVILAKNDGYYYTFKSAREHVRRGSESSIAVEDDPQRELERQVPAIVKASLKELEAKKTVPVTNSHAYLTLLGNLVASLDGIDEELDAIVKVLEALSRTKVSLMPEILALVSTILEYSSGSSHLGQLASVITRGIQDSYYKVASDALAVSEVLAKRLGATSARLTDDLLKDLVENTIKRSNDISLDLETRERATRALAHLVPNTQAVNLDSVIQDLCNVISNLLASETTRLVSMEAIDVLCSSEKPPSISSDWLSSWIEKLLTLLNQNSRQVRVSALRALRAITQYARDHDVEGDLSASLQQACTTLLQKYTVQEGGNSEAVVLNLATMILTNAVRYVDPAGLSNFILGVIGEQYQAAPLISTSNVVQIGSSSNESLERLVREFVLVHRSSEPVMKSLLEMVTNKRTSNPDLAAKVVATIITAVPLDTKLVEVSQNIENGVDLQWSILLYGNIGHLVPLSADLGPLYSRLQKGDELKLVVTQAIGQIVAKNPEPYLDELLQRVSSSSDDAFLYVAAIRGVIEGAGKDLVLHAEKIWASLFQIDAEGEESEQAVIAECVGRLAILNPETFLPQLRSYISSPRASVRATVVSAVKYTFGQSDARYDGLLRPIVADFLALMDDDDINIRQLALAALVSALHNKPHLVIPHLGRLLPLLYRETIVREDLIRVVQMGPFKHNIDDGLDLRKSAYETIYTLVSTTSAEQFNSFATVDQLVERVIAGLSDKDHDIKVLSCLIIGKLASLDISILTSGGTLDVVITKFSGLLAVVVKENAIKQDFEKQSEIVRNVHRASSQIDAAISQAIAANKNIALSDVELGNWTKYHAKVVADSKAHTK